MLLILRNEHNRGFWLGYSLHVTKDDLTKRPARYRQIRVSVIGRRSRAGNLDTIRTSVGLRSRT